MTRKEKRRMIETIKGGIAFTVLIISIALLDSERYYIAFAIISILSLLYLKIIAGRIMK